jgi:hypothetical protein
MAKFYGEVGYANTVEKSPGIWEDVIAERKYYGDVVRNTRKLEDGQKLNDDLSIGNSFSILADAYAYENFFAMRYIKWAGSCWKISDVEVVAPRLLLRVGGIYNGPKAPAPIAP